jgi:hypothetical protein
MEIQQLVIVVILPGLKVQFYKYSKYFRYFGFPFAYLFEERYELYRTNWFIVACSAWLILKIPIGILHLFVNNFETFHTSADRYNSVYIISIVVASIFFGYFTIRIQLIISIRFLCSSIGELFLYSYI